MSRLKGAHKSTQGTLEPHQCPSFADAQAAALIDCRCKKCLFAGRGRTVFFAKVRSWGRVIIKIECRKCWWFVSRVEQEVIALKNAAPFGAPELLAHGETSTLRYLVVRYLKGVPLNCGLPRRSVSEILRIGVELCRVAERLHNGGYVHHDIKPSNIVIDRKGRIRLIDFETLCSFDPNSPFMEPNKDFMVLGAENGTVGTLEPFSGCSSDPRIDVYAIGATMFWLFSGRLPLPFSAFDVHPKTSNRQLMDIVDKYPAPRLDEVTPCVTRAVSDVIARAIAFSRTERFYTAADLRAALERIRSITVSTAVPNVVRTFSTHSDPPALAEANVVATGAKTTNA